WLPTPPGWPQKSHRGSCGGLRKHAEIPSRFPTTLARLADGFGPSGWPYPAGEAARIHPGKLGPPLRAQARIQRTSMPVKVSGIVGASLFYVNGRILTTPGKAWKFVALGGRARGCAHGGRSLRPSWPPLARARAAPPSMAPRLALRPRGHTPWPALWPRHGPARGPWPRGQEAEPPVLRGRVEAEVSAEGPHVPEVFAPGRITGTESVGFGHGAEALACQDGEQTVQKAGFQRNIQVFVFACPAAQRCLPFKPRLEAGPAPAG